jgi:hypothetical protein
MGITISRIAMAWLIASGAFSLLWEVRVIDRSEMTFTGGHKTIDTGQRDQHGLPIYRHEALTEAEARAVWEHAERSQAERAERMPDEKAAIEALWSAHQRLRELGWSEPQYCPKDGTRFKVIELGSTGIFDCYYHGEWPKGHYMVMDEHDCYPTSTGVAMYRLYPEDEAKRKQRLAEAAARYRAERDAEDASTISQAQGGSE